MNDATFPGPPLRLERAEGAVRLEAARSQGRNRLAELFQSGCGRLLFPAVARESPLEAVVVNTAGGLTGGDRLKVAATAREGAGLVLTTQACEKVYRSAGGAAVVATRLDLGSGAALSWLPQETILFDRSSLSRRLDVAMASSATLLVVEAVLLGRRASGERVSQIAFRDSWRVRRDGRLVFAEEMRLGQDLARALAAPATLAGVAAFATVLLASPHAESHVERLRALTMNEAVEAGFSSFDGLCVGRLVAQDGAGLRAALVAVLQALGGTVPRVWSI